VEHIRDYIPEEVHDFILDTIYKYLEQLKKTLGLDKSQMRHVNDLEPESIEYPIELNEHGVSQLHHRISAQANVINFDLLMDISRKLSSLKQYILELYETFLEFDLFCTIGYFAYEYQLSIPTFIKDRNGFYGNNMRNLELMEEMPVEMVEPIQYQIGEIVPQKLNEEIKKARLNLLTGSNSGGKTICIKTCAEGLMLAQMGFPSLGDLTLSPFDEIYYFKKSNGQISAGAFETTLIQFVEMAQSNKKKIIFADELESITEPSAASRVLSGIFSLLLKNPLNYGVFVTHLVEMIREELREDDLRNIRIDGIEAKGLDKDLELMVDRTPKFSFIARSTPELILSRLSKLGSRQQKDFFDSLLKKF